MGIFMDTPYIAGRRAHVMGVKIARTRPLFPKFGQGLPLGTNKQFFADKASNTPAPLHHCTTL